MSERTRLRIEGLAPGRGSKFDVLPAPTPGATSSSLRVPSPTPNVTPVTYAAAVLTEAHGIYSRATRQLVEGRLGAASRRLHIEEPS